jgi:hypothetical protein
MSLRKNPDELAGHGAAMPDGEAPMTTAQRDQLKELARRAGDTEAYDETLTSAEAQKRIAALQVLLDREAHSGIERLPRT